NSAIAHAAISANITTRNVTICLSLIISNSYKSRQIYFYLVTFGFLNHFKPQKMNTNPPEDQYSRNEDLENYFANTIIPQLFIDGDFILRKFTPPAMTHFSLTEADVDRDINEVKDK